MTHGYNHCSLWPCRCFPIGILDGRGLPGHDALPVAVGVAFRLPGGILDRRNQVIAGGIGGRGVQGLGIAAGVALQLGGLDVPRLVIPHGLGHHVVGHRGQPVLVGAVIGIGIGPVPV